MDLVDLPADQLEYCCFLLSDFHHAQALACRPPAYSAKARKKRDASKWLILLLVIMTWGMCLIAIVLELTHLPRSNHQIWTLGSVFADHISAWFFILPRVCYSLCVTIISLPANQQDAGLDFPKKPHSRPIPTSYTLVMWLAPGANRGRFHHLPPYAHSEIFCILFWLMVF